MDIFEVLKFNYKALIVCTMPAKIEKCLLFTGQFETYLFQKGEPVILEAIKKCWASSYSLRVMQHRLDCGLSTNNITMAVVIQVCLLVLIYHDNVERNVLLVLQLHNRYRIRQNF